MFVIKDLLRVNPRLQRPLAYRKGSIDKGEPVFTMDLGKIVNQELGGGWLVNEVRIRWVKAPSTPYCHRIEFSHAVHGTLEIYTGFKSGPHVRASGKPAWDHFKRFGGARFLPLNTDVV